MKPRRPARGQPRPRQHTIGNQQPGNPAGEARLLGVDRVGRTVVVVLADGRSFELDQQSLPDRLPPVGQVVPAEVVAQLEAARQRKLAARDLMTMLGRSLQPVARLRRKLLDKGHAPEAVEQVLDMMQSRGLCSDRAYAEAYCRDTLRAKAVGSGYLVARLRSRQVPSAVAREAVAATLDPEQEQELALQAATVRWRRLGGEADVAALAKVVRYLLGRGFSPAVANAAARRARPDSPGGTDAT